MNLTTSHDACNTLIDILLENKITDAIISPGSRNAPLIIAFARCKEINKKVIIDERSAAFVALGIAQQSGKPVVLVCTSGTALLNYMPAIAEAKYQKIPLIVISADRPFEWIDQDDSQTLLQHGVYGNLVKKSYNIPARYDCDDLKWFVNRTINEACMAATINKDVVHLNIEFAEPLCDVGVRKNILTRVITSIDVKNTLDESIVKELAVQYCKANKVMIVAGFGDNDEVLQRSISYLSTLNNTIVFAETVSNLRGVNIIQNIDRLLSALDVNEFDELKPELLITFGGALVTRMLKHKLRTHKPLAHWHIGYDSNVIDTMQSLTHKINIAPKDFFAILAKNIIQNNKSDYSNNWKRVSEKAKTSQFHYLEKIPWCDFKAFEIIFANLPAHCRLQLSNGTSIRYAQLFGDIINCQCNCNRGVAGIDGSTSTALGASFAYSGTTLLVTGDMSFNYDIGALACQYKNNKFKIIVICNGGGGIFRFLKGTSSLPELDDYFEVQNKFNVKGYAEASGYECFEASSEVELKSVLKDFYISENTAILCIYTPNKLNAEILREYFKR